MSTELNSTATPIAAGPAFVTPTANQPLNQLTNRAETGISKESQGGQGNTLKEPDLDIILQYTTGIVDKRHDLYQWCEQKIASLATIDGILLAGVFLLIGGGAHHHPHIFLGAAIESLICLTISLITSLWHIIPIKDAKVGNSTNIRTIIGIESFKTADDYYQACLKLDTNSMIRYNAMQIKGMTRNISRDHRAIRYGASASIASLVGLIIMVLLKIDF
jgi:hypothetical protein